MTAPDPLAGTFGKAKVAEAERTAMIRATFEAVAPRYDLMNDLMSMGIHRLWKRRFARLIAPRKGETIVDLGGGTGDIALLLAPSGARVIVADPSLAMMTAGRQRAGGGGIEWVEAEAEALPFADASIDALCIAFGIRNVTRLDAALVEIRRVLKPGGRFYCLEFSQAAPWLAPLYGLWSRTVIPMLGMMVSGKREAYRYLVESIARFPDQHAFARLIDAAGFAEVRYQNLSFGIAAIHSAVRP